MLLVSAFESSDAPHSVCRVQRNARRPDLLICGPFDGGSNYTRSQITIQDNVYDLW